MSVTLEWSATLVRHHGMPPSQLRIAANMMRAKYVGGWLLWGRGHLGWRGSFSAHRLLDRGVRRQNVLKNTNGRQYAFNEEQVRDGSWGVALGRSIGVDVRLRFGAPSFMLTLFPRQVHNCLPPLMAPPPGTYRGNVAT